MPTELSAIEYVDSVISDERLTIVGFVDVFPEAVGGVKWRIRGIRACRSEHIFVNKNGATSISQANGILTINLVYNPFSDTIWSIVT